MTDSDWLDDDEDQDSATAGVSTSDLLRSLGFTKDTSVISDLPGGLSLDFGSFKLEASHVINLHFQPIVLLGGVSATPRTVSLIEFEMPRRVESWEQGVAWLAWNLDRHASGRVFKPAVPMPWLDIGRAHTDLLPWERKRAAYAARPACRVRRNWARLLIRELGAVTRDADGATKVRISFDGEVLILRCADAVIAAPATGDPWPSSFSIIAEKLRQLPKRLSRDPVVIDVWEDQFSICRRVFTGIQAEQPMERRESKRDT